MVQFSFESEVAAPISHEVMTATPSPQAMYNAVVDAIVKAVPEILQSFVVTESFRSDGSLDPTKTELRQRPITLEDVLRAIRDVHGLHASSKVSATPLGALFGTAWSRSDCEWHLGRSLEWHRDNAPETIAFLYPLLPKK